MRHTATRSINNVEPITRIRARKVCSFLRFKLIIAPTLEHSRFRYASTDVEFARTLQPRAWRTKKTNRSVLSYNNCIISATRAYCIFVHNTRAQVNTHTY